MVYRRCRILLDILECFASSPFGSGMDADEIKQQAAAIENERKVTGWLSTSRFPFLLLIFLTWVFPSFSSLLSLSCDCTRVSTSCVCFLDTNSFSARNDQATSQTNREKDNLTETKKRRTMLEHKHTHTGTTTQTSKTKNTTNETRHD